MTLERRLTALEQRRPPLPTGEDAIQRLIRESPEAAAIAERIGTRDVERDHEAADLACQLLEMVSLREKGYAGGICLPGRVVMGAV